MTPGDVADDRPSLPDDAEVGAADTAVSEELAHHPLRSIDRDGKADALGHPNDGGVDADDARPRVNQGAARVPRIQRDVSLNDVLDEPSRSASQGSAYGADHTRRHGRLKSEGITDGDDELSGPERRGRSELSDEEPRTVGPDHGEIGRRVAADERRP